VSMLFFQAVMPYGLTGRYQLLEKHMVCIFRCQYLPMSLSRHHKTEQHWHFHHCDNLKSHIKHPSMLVSFITFQNTNFVKPVQNEFILIYSVVWTPASHVQNTLTHNHTQSHLNVSITVYSALNYGYDWRMSVNTHLSLSDSTWNIRSMTVVHCRPRMRNVYGLGRSEVMIWQPFTVKLLSGSLRLCSGFVLKPISEPSSSNTK
jgi:hypothetical protein